MHKNRPLPNTSHMDTKIARLQIVGHIAWHGMAWHGMAY